MSLDRILRLYADRVSAWRTSVPIAGTLLLLTLALPATAQTLPAAAANLLPGLREAGSGTFRYFGLLVYDARLWTAGAHYDPASPFALGIRYARHIKGVDLAEETVRQWRDMRYGFEHKYAAWEAAMRRIFPDVRPGDELVGVHLPAEGAQFYFNGRPAGTIADTAFTRAFFAIWLDARTTEPGLRRALLAER